ncbi:hypothetical protein ACLKA6_013122 [Drosophila palustris]
MFKKSFLLLLATYFAIAAGSGDSAGQKAARGQVQPRLLWLKRGESKAQQPIVIVQPSNSESDRHHHHPSYWPDYYPYPPPRPQRPPYNIPGLSEYLGNGPSIVIINPNNAQNLTFPAAASTTTAGGRNAANRRSSNPIVDLLQESILDDDTEVISAPENVEAEEVAPVPQQQQQQQQQQLPVALYGGEERDEDYGEDELALLERQATRGLNPKQLLSFLLQDKRRRRFQEAVAGVYLRNFNLSRK